MKFSYILIVATVTGLFIFSGCQKSSTDKRLSPQEKSSIRASAYAGGTETHEVLDDEEEKHKEARY